MSKEFIPGHRYYIYREILQDIVHLCGFKNTNEFAAAAGINATTAYAVLGTPGRKVCYKTLMKICRVTGSLPEEIAERAE